MSTLRTLSPGTITLPSGRTLAAPVLPYTLSSPPHPSGDNLVLLFPSMTGRPDPAGWWPELVRPGGVLDPERWALLTPALPGGVAFPHPGSEPGFTVRDMAFLAALLVRSLGVRGVHLVAGGSVGGMVALEWAASNPLPTRTVVSFAAPAARTAHALGVNRVQRRALALGGPRRGLALAREMAMLTYRTPAGLEARFADRKEPDGSWSVASWLRHHGRTLPDRMDAAAYLRLLDAMDGHDVGADRGGAGPALRAFPGTLVGVGVEGDLLYPPETIQRWTRAAGARYREIRTLHGHDAFLLEEDQVGAILSLSLRPEKLPCALPLSS